MDDGRKIIAVLAIVWLVSCSAQGPFSELSGENNAYSMTSLPTLRSTGFYEQDSGDVADDLWPYAPRFPLYSDSLEKTRYLHLPSGSTIQGADTDHWSFPVGTKIWKEFALGDGRKIETRFMEKVAGGWHFGVYVWNEQQTEALLWSGSSIPQAASFEIPGRGSSRQQVEYSIPSYQDCLSCHRSDERSGEAHADPVLGFQAFQLSRTQLAELTDRHMLEGASINSMAHNIPARNGRERAVVGYLHGNCGHCHNPRRPRMTSRPFDLSYRVEGISTWRDIPLLHHINRPAANSQVPIPGSPGRPLLIKPRFPEQSMIFHRMGTVQGHFVMPRIGVHSRDFRFIDGVMRPWIQTLSP